MDSAQVGVFKERHEVGLNRLLQGTDGGRLESKVGLEVLGDLTDETLEWQLPDEKLGRLLVATDFSQGDGTLRCNVSKAGHAREKEQFVGGTQTHQACIGEAS